jgi:hypothetical protein
MNNEKNSIYQEYFEIQERKQWMDFYQVASGAKDALAERFKAFSDAIIVP